MSWKTELIRPIVPAKGKPIVTYLDAFKYILTKSKAEQNSPMMQSAAKAIIAAAEGRGPDLSAQAAAAHAVHGEPQPLNRPKPDAHWRRKWL